MPRDTFLPFSPPSLGREEIDEVASVLRSDWISTGPRTKEFEAAFGRYVGAPGETSLMLNSCTAGLHVALATLGVGPGDEVIVPTLTFAATANVVEHVGAKPVLVDVLPDTLCIDPDAVAAAVTPHTRAIMPVHYAGQAADLDPIQAVADAHDLHVVEDAAHAIPTTYRGRMIGSGQNLASFSFYATKNLTTGEGGALTGSPELLDQARVVGLHGMSRDGWKRFDKAGSWEYDIELPGFKYNMTDIQSALGLRQLEKLAGFHARRREIVARYQEAFGADGRFETPVEAPYGESSWHLYVLRLAAGSGLERNAFVDGLKERNIGFSVHYKPLHMMSFYANKYGFRPEDFPVAYDSYRRMFSLPLHPRLSEGDVEDVIEAVLAVADDLALRPDAQQRTPAGAR